MEHFMPAVLSRWGNSLAIRLPTNILEKTNFQEGDQLDVRVSRSGRITLEAVVKSPDFGVLYDAITPENRYESVTVSGELGREAVAW
jgi:antitoxin MazE